jgi:hypothetical protein
MILERVRDWLDNPILVKHLRSRLRKQPLITSIVVVQALCLCIVWAGYQFGSFGSGRPFGWLYMLQIVILPILGGAQAGGAVGGARASGILDFHRVSPLSATELLLGFFFGAPIREYVLVATTLPYAVLCMAFGEPPFHEFIQWTILLIFTAWLFHGLAILNGLVTKPRTSGGRAAIGVFIFLMFVVWNFLMSFGRVSLGVDLGARLTFFGADLPWLAVVVMHEAAMLFFVRLACSRKIASERIHPLSKPQATAALATLSILIIGDAWKKTAEPPFMLAVLYALVVAGVLLIPMVTPTQAEFVKGLWRARKQGRNRLPAWDDLALNRVFLAIACAIVLVTATFVWNGVAAVSAPFYQTNLEGYPIAIAASVLVVAYFGLALQYFNLRYGARGKLYFGLFLFLVWLLPLVGGTIVLMASSFNSNGDPAQIIFSLSPIAGIGTSAAATTHPVLLKAIQAAAIAPALGFTFVFNTLLIAAHRRVLKDFAASTQKPPPAHADADADVREALAPV